LAVQETLGRVPRTVQAMAHFKRHTTFVLLATAIVTTVTLSACKTSEQKKELAPEASRLMPVKETAATERFDVDSQTNVSFEMDAELEHISGRAPNSASGDLHLSLTNVTKSTGIVKIDLLELSIFQKKRDSSDADFGEEKRNDSQNDHMRTWLQISEDGAASERERNRYLEFQIKEVKTTTSADLSKLEGPERKLDLEITGDVRLHGRVTSHTFPAQAVFSYNGEKAISVKVESKKPLYINLEKHDVRPRSAFNSLADKTLAALGSKVSKIAKVSFVLLAKAN
jgi:hypothetical protein